MESAIGSGSSERRVAHVALLAALYSLPAAIGFRPVIDLDIWWHLRQGAWIVENRTVPFTDPFTSYGLGKTWIAYSWLYEIIVYGLYRLSGVFGIVLYTTALAFGITFALHRCLRQLSGDLLVASGLTALAIAGMFPVLVEPRPWLFNVLFVILELTVLLEVRRSGSTRPLWMLPPLFLVWACINIQFIYGLFILFLAVIEAILSQRLSRHRNEAPNRSGAFRTKPMLLTLAASLVATCLTPYHVNVYIPVITAIKLTDPFYFLKELQAPSFRLVFDWVALGLLLSATFAVGRRWPGPFLVLLLTTGAFLGFRAHRDVWLLVTASAIILATVRVPSAVPRVTLCARHWALVGVIVVAVSMSLGVTRASVSRLDRAIAEKFPVDAAAFVESHGYRGRVYNHYDWGGYLMWRLPDIDVVLDGRNPLHGDARIWDSIRTWGGHPGWASDPELAQANLVIADVNTALASLLRQDPRFALVYEDRVAAVFISR
jgi:hypothetical protein